VARVFRHLRRRDPGGFTLIEMLVAMTLTMLVFAITIPFFRAQTRAVGSGAGRLDALQNARYAQGYIDRELRRAGGVFGQPVIVQAAPFSITFNTDLYARDSVADPNAAYYSAALDTLTTESFQVGLAKALPRAGKVYPTATYSDSNGTRSPAETISFFLIADASSGRSDIYSLYRRVNAKDSTLVTTNLWIPADTGYFFRYYRMADSGAISLIPQASLPLYWDDATRTIDSIGVVEMRIAGWYYNPRDATDTYRTVYQRTRIGNALQLTPRSCGAAPTAPSGVTGTRINNSYGDPVQVTIAWTASTDDGAGAADVQSYVVMRRPSAGTTWTSVGNVPARSSGSYSFADYSLRQGTWVYGVAAVDCGPQWSSTTAQTGTVTIP
jgi:prepilin-type N-terminal cleavage/methylation domain-containing protein